MIIEDLSEDNTVSVKLEPDDVKPEAGLVIEDFDSNDGFSDIAFKQV